MDRASDLIIDVIDHPHVSRWFKELQKNDKNGYNRLVGNNIHRFERIYGNATKTTDSEEWSHRWDRNLNRLDWIILSGEKTGSIYRIKTALTAEEFTSDARIGIGIIEYLSELCEILMGKYTY